MTGRGAPAPATPGRLGLFERRLSPWVLLCMAAGGVPGRSFPAQAAAPSRLEFGTGSHISIPIAVLIWLMICPMMPRIEFSGVTAALHRARGLRVTLFVTWVVTPFRMACRGWLFLPWYQRGRA